MPQCPIRPRFAFVQPYLQVLAGIEGSGCDEAHLEAALRWSRPPSQGRAATQAAPQCALLHGRQMASRPGCQRWPMGLLAWYVGCISQAGWAQFVEGPTQSQSGCSHTGIRCQEACWRPPRPEQPSLASAQGTWFGARFTKGCEYSAQGRAESQKGSGRACRTAGSVARVGSGIAADFREGENPPHQRAQQERPGAARGNSAAGAGAGTSPQGSVRGQRGSRGAGAPARQRVRRADGDGPMGRRYDPGRRPPASSGSKHGSMHTAAGEHACENDECGTTDPNGGFYAWCAGGIKTGSGNCWWRLTASAFSSPTHWEAEPILAASPNVTFAAFDPYSVPAEAQQAGAMLQMSHVGGCAVSPKHAPPRTPKARQSVKDAAKPQGPIHSSSPSTSFQTKVDMKRAALTAQLSEQPKVQNFIIHDDDTGQEPVREELHRTSQDMD